jgi:hypothetical protein
MTFVITHHLVAECKGCLRMKFNTADYLCLFLLALASAGGFILIGADVTAGPNVQAASSPPGDISLGLWKGNKTFVGGYNISDSFLNPRYVRGYRPEQPVKYSHQAHVEKTGMECQYCHSGVHKSAFAVIPSLESCMACHTYVKPESAEVKKVKEYWDARKPIEWIPVSNLPEYVQVDHKRHLAAGIACYVCHGQVNRMEVVEKTSSFKMGFCLSCHRETGASSDCGVCHN